MALQHFYSRVPFRMSMFNKTDSFDTFACSKNLERAFIEKELSPVLDRKTTVEENTLIRENKLPPIYCSYFSKNGELIQSCITSVPEDYTGERSAYFVHSLIYNEEEKKALSEDPDNGLFNSDLFEKDLSKFDITNPEGEPISDYPEKNIVTVKAGSTENLIKDYDEKMLKRFIYALLDTTLGKTKSVFFTFREPTEPKEILDFFNSVLLIFPYHLREKLSFVSCLYDYNNFSAFKIKYLKKETTELPHSKGVYLRFDNNTYTGFKEEQFASHSGLVDFFYSLLSNETIRHEFLHFSKEAVSKVPSLATEKMQSLHSLVYLFLCGCPYYETKDVLSNDDRVLEFLDTYDKARDALSDDYRIHAFKCLERYPSEHREIPKNIFTKITKIYPNEHLPCKNIIMGVILDLIHTDIMRNKLFTFIKNNFEGEEPHNREKIVENLSRVFYGGFLQSQLLSFFQEQFEKMSPKNKEEVLDKLLLSIRTKGVQGEILNFIRKNSPFFTEHNKEQLYSSIGEHLKEGDELTEQLLSIADAEEKNVTGALLQSYNEQLLSLVESEQRKKTHPLLELLCKTEGYSFHLLAKKVLEDFTGRKIFEEFTVLSCKHSFENYLSQTVAILDETENFSKEKISLIVGRIETAESENKKIGDLFEFIKMKDLFLKATESSSSQAVKLFLLKLSKELVIPKIQDHLQTVFLHLEMDNAVETALSFINDLPVLKKCPKYTLLTDYMAMKEAASQIALGKRPTSFLREYKKFLINKPIKKMVGRYMEKDLLSNNVSYGEPSRSFLYVCCMLLSEKEISFVSLYSELLSKYSEEENENENKKENYVPLFSAISTLLNVGNLLYNSSVEELKNLVAGEDSDFKEALKALKTEKHSSGIKFLKKELSTLNPQNEDFAKLCKGAVKRKGLFSRN